MSATLLDIPGAEIAPGILTKYPVPCCVHDLTGPMTDDARIWLLHELKTIVCLGVNDGIDCTGYFRMMMVISRGWATSVDRHGGSNRGTGSPESRKCPCP